MDTEFQSWRLPSGQLLVLCRGCELEEFMVPTGWGYRLGLSAYGLPINALQPVSSVPSVSGLDKFCPQCNLRLAFLKVVESLVEIGVIGRPEIG